MVKRIPLATGLGGLLLLLAGCAPVRIGRILADPLRYQNRQVQVEGTVTGGVNAFVGGAYQVDDGTGRIFVLSGGGAPKRGDRVRVKGRVQNGVTVLGRGYGTAISEKDRRVFYNPYRRY